MTANAVTLDDLDITSPEVYTAAGYPYAAWARLRRDAPVYWYERPMVQPFWAITKYDDIQRISRDPKTFINSNGLVISSDSDQEPDFPQRHLLVMDPPEHGKYRNLVTRRFSPRGLELLESAVERLAAEVVDAIADRLVEDVAQRGEADFVTEVAAKLPLAVICRMLGVPEQDWDDIFRWTNETIGAADPEYQAGRSSRETARDARLAMFERFSSLLAERREQPQDDILSTLAAAEIDGRPLDDFDILSYCFLLILGGNETTRNATSGGILALIEHPDQLARLRADPALLPQAIEEILRWTSPIIHFARRVTADVEIRGQAIPSGDLLVMWYPSANRDEDVFDAPDEFDVGRSPNEHLAFGGFGEHFCLGANLARLELQTIFTKLLDRLDGFELNGDVERLRSGFVGGIKHLPVRFQPRPAAH